MMATINIVAAGGGISLVPASMQTLHREAVVYCPLARGTLPPLPLYLVYQGDQNLKLVKNFIQVATDVGLKSSSRKVTIITPMQKVTAASLRKASPGQLIVFASSIDELAQHAFTVN